MTTMARKFGEYIKGNLVAYVALFLALGGVTYAAIPNSDGTIMGCSNIRTGLLRVIDPAAGQSCTGGEAALSWKDGIHGKVADADLLDGHNSTDFLDATAKAADADRLDGKDSTEFGAPTDVYREVVLGVVDIVPQQTMTLASKSVPAGLYVHIAKVVLGNRDSTLGASIFCAVRGDSATVQIPPGGMQALTLVGVQSALFPERFQCEQRSISEGDAYALNVNFVLIKIDSIH